MNQRVYWSFHVTFNKNMECFVTFERKIHGQMNKSIQSDSTNYFIKAVDCT